MFGRCIRSRPFFLQSIRVALLSAILVLVFILVTPENSLDLRSHKRNIHKVVQHHLNRTKDLLSQYRGLVPGDETFEFDPLEEISDITVDTPRLVDHKDLAGEWFERPMILRDSDMNNLVQTESSSSPPDLTFISIDYKLGPIFALKHQLMSHGVKVIDNSLSSYCHMTDSCADVKVLSPDTGLQLSSDDILKFWRRNRHEPEFVRADGFICIYPASLCELFIPFNKTMIIIVDNRYELGRTKKQRWITWNDNFKNVVADDTNHIVVATNPYDMEYVRYFTAIALPVVPYSCDYVTKRYTPKQSSFLLMPLKKEGMEKMILERLRSEMEDKDMTGDVESVSSLYGSSYTTDQLRQHAGLIVIPHQVSFLSMTEILRLNIPLYFPTVELLSRWHADTQVMTERTLKSYNAHGHRSKGGSPLPGIGGLPDPNEENKLWAIGFWLTFAEYFSWPGVKHFDSVEDLAAKLNATTGEDLYYASERIRVFNEQEKMHVNHFWKSAIDRLKNLKNKKSKN